MKLKLVEFIKHAVWADHQFFTSSALRNHESFISACFCVCNKCKIPRSENNNSSVYQIKILHKFNSAAQRICSEYNFNSVFYELGRKKFLL